MIEHFLSPAAILISAGGAWWFAKQAIDSNREISRKRATFDYISKLSWDNDYIEAKNTFLAIHAGPTKLRAIAEQYEDAKKNVDLAEDQRDQIVSDHSAIVNLLNEYEAMAVAIKAGALDEEMMRLNIRQQIVRHVQAKAFRLNPEALIQGETRETFICRARFAKICDSGFSRNALAVNSSNSSEAIAALRNRKKSGMKFKSLPACGTRWIERDTVNQYSFSVLKRFILPPGHLL